MAHNVTGSISVCSPQDGMLVHYRVTPSTQFHSTHWYVERSRHCESNIIKKDLLKNTPHYVPSKGSNPEWFTQKLVNNHEKTTPPQFNFIY